MKKLLIVAGIILLIAGVAAGSFYGGIAYQTNKVNQARLNFENARGQASGGQAPGNGAGFPEGGAPNGQAPGGGFGGGTIGQVKTIEGNVMTVSTAQDVTTVNLTSETQIEKSVAGTTDDLQPGVRVMITGQKDSNGNITASQITIMNGDLPGMPYPSPTQQEP
jgi:hypothetical protein